MTRTRKTTLLITSVTIGASNLLGAITSPAGAAEVARYNLTQAWPSSDDPGPVHVDRAGRIRRPAAPARSSSSGRSRRARADAYQTSDRSCGPDLSSRSVLESERPMISGNPTVWRGKRCGSRSD